MIGAAMWCRLRNDFQLALITLLGACGAAGILPFALYRFSLGHWLIGVIDTAIVLAIVGAVVYAWRTGDTRRSGGFIVVVDTAGAIVIALLLGLPGLLWTYPVILSNHFLVDRRKAAVASAVVLGTLAIDGRAFTSTLQMALFIVTGTVTTLFAFIFAQRTESQRLQLEALATLDPLTGAQNRRAMEQELAIAQERLRREGVSSGLLVLDIDHFKAVNDRHGHEAGDQVLVSLVELVRGCTRTVDRFFRFGGEEFVLLLSPASTPAMHAIATKLCRTIGGQLRWAGDPVTVSIGGAALHAGEDWHAWLARADAALYRAKRDGRNRAVVDEAQPVAAVQRSA